MSQMRKISLILGISLSSFSFSLYAAPDGPYAGISLGQSDMGYTASNQKLTPASATNRKGLGYNGLLGYQMNKNLGLQFDYFQYHDMTFKNIGGISGANTDYTQNAIDLAAKFILPFGSGFNAFATVGVAYVKLDRDPNSAAKTYGVSSSDKTGVRPDYGLGLAYDFYPGWSVQAIWTQFPSGGAIEKTSYTGLGLNYYFGSF